MKKKKTQIEASQRKKYIWPISKRKREFNIISLQENSIKSKRYHSTLSRMAKFKKIDNTKFCQKYEASSDTECNIVQSIWKTVFFF